MSETGGDLTLTTEGHEGGLQLRDTRGGLEKHNSEMEDEMAI